jgi:HPt (histidine-containing phosphotransfer) domain-containing protein
MTVCCNSSSKQHQEIKMPLETEQDEQFNVLITSDIDINHLSSKPQRQNIIVATEYDDILMLIKTTQFDLILLDLSISCSAASVPEQLRHLPHPWQSELITRIRDPLGINNKTPIIGVINSTEGYQGEKQCLIEADDWLVKPISENQLNETMDVWQTKTIALAYIQIILNKTKNNQRLTLTIFEKLFEEIPQQIVQIKDALENKQYGHAKEITHKLNGSVSFCGLTDIQKPANTLESSLLNNNYKAISQHFRILQQCTSSFTRHQEFIMKTLMSQSHKKSP